MRCQLSQANKVFICSTLINCQKNGRKYQETSKDGCQYDFNPYNHGLI